MNACKDSPNLDVAVGIVMDRGEARDIEHFDSKKYWDWGAGIIVHVWNVDKKSGQVVDKTLGSKDKIYLGKIVKNASNFKSDDALLDYAHDFVYSKYPTDFSSQDAEYEKWAANK